MASKTDALKKRRRLPYKAGLTLSLAKKMLDAGINEAEKRRMPVAIAIADAGGNLLAFNRMDKAALFAIQIALDKAFTAVFGKWHTGNWSNMYKSGALVPLFFHEKWITFPGGLPLVKNGAIWGGIGVSGGVHEDLYIARAAVEAGGFSLDDVEEAINPVAKASKSKKE